MQKLFVVKSAYLDSKFGSLNRGDKFYADDEDLIVKGFIKDKQVELVKDDAPAEEAVEEKEVKSKKERK